MWQQPFRQSQPLGSAIPQKPHIPIIVHAHPVLRSRKSPPDEAARMNSEHQQHFIRYLRSLADDASAKTGIDPATLHDILEGNTPPTDTQLRDAAGRANLPPQDILKLGRES